MTNRHGIEACATEDGHSVCGNCLTKNHQGAGCQVDGFYRTTDISFIADTTGNTFTAIVRTLNNNPLTDAQFALDTGAVVYFKFGITAFIVNAVNNDTAETIDGTDHSPVLCSTAAR